jgi:hypothetical protein
MEDEEDKERRCGRITEGDERLQKRRCEGEAKGISESLKMLMFADEEKKFILYTTASSKKFYSGVQSTSFRTIIFSVKSMCLSLYFRQHYRWEA